MPIVFVGSLLALAGCSSPAAHLTSGDGGAGGDGTDASGGLAGASGAAHHSGATSKGGKAPAGTSTSVLHGRVHDAANLSIEGASVAVLSTSLQAKTDGHGGFHIEDVPAGERTVRVESSGFDAVELPVSVAAGKVVDLDVTLRPNAVLGASYAPHTHDFWGTDTQRVLMDDTVTFGDSVSVGKSPSADAVNRPNQGTVFEFPLPESLDGRPQTVWPGTAQLVFTLSWDTGTENDLPAVGIRYVPANETPGPGTTPGHDLGHVTNGGSMTLGLDPNMTDNGHQPYTAWEFYLYVANHLTNDPTHWEPALGRDGVHVKIVQVKGQVVLEPAHRDFWQGNDTLVLGDPGHEYWPNTGAPPTAAGAQGMGHDFPITGTKETLNIVPPGTQTLRVTFSWYWVANNQRTPDLPFTYSLRYRTASQDPHETPLSDYKAPRLVASPDAKTRVYEIDVSPADVDGFYQTKTLWAFHWDEDGGRPYYLTGFEVRFNMVFTAVKDPSF